MNRTLSSYAVLSFDCYGTLIDWEAGIWDRLAPLASAAGLSRADLLSRYASAEATIEAEHPSLPYRELLPVVYYRLAEELGVDTDDRIATAFARSVGSWPPFPDSAQALQTLSEHHKLVILSNVDRESFAGSQQHLGVEFDAIYTAEDIGSYKPSPENFEYLINRAGAEFGATPDDILHVAQSLYHDHVPAIAAGLCTAWIDRQQLSRGGQWGATARVASPPTPRYTFFSMGEFAGAVGSDF